MENQVYKVIYFYENKNKNGRFSSKLKQKKVEYTLDLKQLANEIQANLFRRDVLIKDVVVKKIIEQDVSFEETPEGELVIDGEMFSEFSGGIKVDFNDKSEDIVYIEKETIEVTQSSQSSQPQVTQSPQVIKNTLVHEQKPTPVSSPYKSLIFDPEPQLLREAARFGVFTMDKEYQVLEWHSSSSLKATMAQFKTIDDRGKEVVVSELYFRPKNPLIDEYSPRKDDVRLTRLNEYSGNMIDVRGR